MNDQWPLALRVDDFKPEREGLRKAVQVALEEDKKGDLEPATVEAVQAAIDRFRLKFEKLVPPTSPDYIPAHDTIKAMAGLTKMLYSPKVEEILAELEDYQGTTLGDLLSFMQAFNLRFAPANSFRQRRIYLKLYPMLAEQANGPVGKLGRRTDGPGRGRGGPPGSRHRRGVGYQSCRRLEIGGRRFLQGDGLETPEWQGQDQALTTVITTPTRAALPRTGLSRP